MKKSTLIAVGTLVAIFLVITPFSNRNAIYEKTMKHSDPREAIEDFIGYANVYEDVRVENRFETRTPPEFFESLSRRYRLSLGDDGNGNQRYFYNSNIPSFNYYEYEEVDGDELEILKKAHNITYKSIPNYKKPEIVKYYKLSGAYVSGYIFNKSDVKEDGSVSFKDVSSDSLGNKGTYYFVVVDEGEGYVVDFYTENPYNTINNLGHKI